MTKILILILLYKANLATELLIFTKPRGFLILFAQESNWERYQKSLELAPRLSHRCDVAGQHHVAAPPQIRGGRPIRDAIVRATPAVALRRASCTPDARLDARAGNRGEHFSVRMS